MKKIIPREPFREERFIGVTPNRETMSRFTFVTGADANYFVCLKELVLSLHQTRYYRNVPIQVLDCGLSHRQKEDIKDYLNGGKIINAPWKTKFEKIYKYDLRDNQTIDYYAPFNQYKVLNLKPYLDRIFPGFTYYMWINPNFWIQDERAIDHYLCVCEDQGYSVSTISWEDLDIPVKNHKLSPFIKNHVSKADFKAISNTPHICEAVCTMRTDFFEAWRSHYERIIDPKNYFYYLTETAAMLAMNELQLRKLVDPKWFGYYYIPLIYLDQPHVLYNLKTGSPMGFVRPVNYENYEHDIFVAQDIYQESNFKTVKASTRYFEALPQPDSMK